MSNASGSKTAMLLADSSSAVAADLVRLYRALGGGWEAADRTCRHVRA